MWKLEIDDKVFQRTFSDLEKRQLPFATMQALNAAMFDVRDRWSQGVLEVFDDPVALTQKAILYNKATREKMYAEVFVRRTVQNGGTAPARYLNPEAVGGRRQEKPFEHLLRNAGVLGANEYVVPAKGFPLDGNGNVPARVIRRILSDLGSQADPQKNASPQSKRRRGRRKKIKDRALYFEASPEFSKSQGKKQHLPRAIFERTSFALGSAIRMAFIIVKSAPQYRVRFDGEAFARSAFADSFPQRFREQLDKAVRNAKIR